MNKKRIFCLTILILILFWQSVLAQDDFNKWLQEEAQKVEKFMKEEDKQFYEFLKKEWKEMQAFQGIEYDTIPEPPQMPVAPIDELEPEKNEFDIPPEIKPPEIEEENNKKSKNLDRDSPEKTPDEPQNKSKEKTINEKSDSFPDLRKKIKNRKAEGFLAFDFYGNKISISIDPKMKDATINSINREEIINYWKKMGTAIYKRCILQCNNYKQKLYLNDWFYAIFLKKLGEQIYSSSPNNSLLFVWFMLIQSGYNVKVGYSDDSLVLLIPVNCNIYEKPFIIYENQRYYYTRLDGKSLDAFSIQTYEGEYPGKTKILNLNVKSTPRLRKNNNKRELEFDYDGHDYNIQVDYNKNIIDLYSKFPQTNIQIYFEANPSPESLKLLKKLEPIIKNKNNIDALNILLSFVQKAFPYKTDPEQFGMEKWMFVDETIFYPFSDCEDRTILFVFLVKELLQLDIIGLDYPGHFATAVHIPQKVYGHVVEHKGKNYYICDPTYLNATVGMCIPKYKHKTLKIIEIKN